jgi:hypothetical protein
MIYGRPGQSRTFGKERIEGSFPRDLRVINYSKDDDMVSILIVCHSQGGNKAQMALAVAEGVHAWRTA